jgi:CheY-like chemotaxis protein
LTYIKDFALQYKFCAVHNNYRANETMQPDTDQPLKGARILLAEDDAILAFDMLCALRSAGAEVVGPASTLADALPLAHGALLTCAVLDVNLRRQTVFPVAEVLKKRSIKIIFHTGHGEWEDLQRRWPQAEVLTKPAPVKLLVRTICESCCGNGCGGRHSCTYCQ